MKLFLGLLLAWVLTAWNDVHAGTWVGQCVYPHAEPFKIVVYENPNKDSVSTVSVQYASYSVQAQSNGWIGIWTTPDYTVDNPYEHANEFVGWVDKKDFDLQALRNCT